MGAARPWRRCKVVVWWWSDEACGVVAGWSLWNKVAVLVTGGWGRWLRWRGYGLQWVKGLSHAQFLVLRNRGPDLGYWCSVVRLGWPMAVRACCGGLGMCSNVWIDNVYTHAYTWKSRVYARVWGGENDLGSTRRLLDLKLGIGCWAYSTCSINNYNEPNLYDKRFRASIKIIRPNTK